VNAHALPLGYAANVVPLQGSATLPSGPIRLACTIGGLRRRAGTDIGAETDKTVDIERALADPSGGGAWMGSRVRRETA
jgi:hypothetical protein